MGSNKKFTEENLRQAIEQTKRQTEKEILERQAKEGPKLAYNPIEVGPDGKARLRSELMMKGPEEFATKERERLGLEQTMGLENLNRGAAQNLAMQRASLASRGGLRGQNAAMLARFNMRDAMLGQQNLGAQGMKQRSELESNVANLQRQTDEQNLKNTALGMERVNAFEMDRWKKQMELQGAKISADAQRDAAPKGKK